MVPATGPGYPMDIYFEINLSHGEQTITTAVSLSHTVYFWIAMYANSYVSLEPISRTKFHSLTGT